jgi:hypothetical protein
MSANLKNTQQNAKQDPTKPRPISTSASPDQATPLPRPRHTDPADEREKSFFKKPLFVMALIVVSAMVLWLGSATNVFADDAVTVTETETSQVVTTVPMADGSKVPEEEITPPTEPEVKDTKAGFMDRISKAWDYTVNDADGQLAEITKREEELTKREQDVGFREELLSDNQAQMQFVYDALTAAAGDLSTCILEANRAITESLPRDET